MREAIEITLINRMIRAAKLDVSLYEEVEIDPAATNQALSVVVIASICTGIGSGVGSLLAGLGAVEFTMGLVGGVASALIGWLIWSFITYFIGTRLFRGPETEATYGELLRCIGFSDSPGVLGIMGFIPLLGGLISSVAWIWSLIAMVIAVRQALDFSTGRAILTCIVGWAVMVVIAIVVGLVIAAPLYI
ncbi:MAG: YIP1 family protein [Candidatus Geothermarchaeales archaeon]